MRIQIWSSLVSRIVRMPSLDFSSSSDSSSSKCQSRGRGTSLEKHEEDWVSLSLKENWKWWRWGIGKLVCTLNIHSDNLSFDFLSAPLEVIFLLFCHSSGPSSRSSCGVGIIHLSGCFWILMNSTSLLYQTIFDSLTNDEIQGDTRSDN